MPKTAIIVGLFLVIFAGNACAERSDVLRCLAGLDSISKDISKNRPELSPRLPRSLYGNLMMAENNRGKSITPSDVPQGSPSDARFCFGEDVNLASLTVLWKAYAGLLSDDPYGDFSKCFAGFISVATEIEQRYGQKAGYDFGFTAGRALGAQFTTLGYLYSNPGPSGEEIQQVAAKRLEDISGLSDQERARHIEEYLDVCDSYAVPVRRMYDDAMALDTTR